MTWLSPQKKVEKKKDEKAWKPSVQLLLHAVLLSFMGPSLYPVKDIQSLIDWKLKTLGFLGPMQKINGAQFCVFPEKKKIYVAFS